jgi:hypothetical protein
MDSTLSHVNTLWIGRSLGPLQRACLRSFLHCGHRVRLFAYDAIAGVPDGVEVCDATDILPRSVIFTHHTGSFALFSDYFRYKLQMLSLGYWIDTDIYCVRPLQFTDGIVLGWESEEYCNGAVLRLPAKCPLLYALLSIFEECRLPWWLPFRERIGFVFDDTQFIRFRTRERFKIATRHHFSRAKLVADLRWGAGGPRAITHNIKTLGLAREVQPRDVFYPVPYKDYAWIFDPTRSLENVITPRTSAVHLWNYLLGSLEGRPVAPGCFFERLLHEGA